MAEIVKAVYRPHPCHDELRELPDDLWIGTIVQCSCGRRWVRAENQWDGYYWADATGEQREADRLRRMPKASN